MSITSPMSALGVYFTNTATQTVNLNDSKVRVMTNTLNNSSVSVPSAAVIPERIPKGIAIRFIRKAHSTDAVKIHYEIKWTDLRRSVFTISASFSDLSRATATNATVTVTGYDNGVGDENHHYNHGSTMILKKETVFVEGADVDETYYGYGTVEFTITDTHSGQSWVSAPIKATYQ